MLNQSRKISLQNGGGLFLKVLIIHKFRIENHSKFKKGVFYVFLSILGFIIDPLVILVLVLGFIPAIIYAIYDYLKERR